MFTGSGARYKLSYLAAVLEILSPIGDKYEYDVVL
ncbi:hypothetical protein Ple7327_1656 [Pleurocapsa sp. PCC 7327]|nr:hypothetical protein Ple7327_1656 [Pleurocapsa sp. PCC 7327]